MKTKTCKKCQTIYYKEKGHKCIKAEFKGVQVVYKERGKK